MGDLWTRMAVATFYATILSGLFSMFVALVVLSAVVWDVLLKYLAG